MSKDKKETPDDMKIVAMVMMNDQWAYVFDRGIHFKYTEETIDGSRFLIGRDGPFVDFFQYKKERSFKAFAGREFTIEMEDGSTRKIKDVWWSCGSPFEGVKEITYNTIENLKKCYVYYGCYCDSKVLDAFINEYENRTIKPYNLPDGGYKYPYFDYEKVIRYKEDTKKLRDRIMKLERDKKNLIREAKRLASKANQIKNSNEGES